MAEEVAEQIIERDDIKQVQGVLAEYDAVAAGIAGLRAKYDGVVFADINTMKGMDAALKARKEVRDPRYAVQRALDRAKKPLNELKARISARAEQIAGELLAIEAPIDAQIKAEEERKEAARLAKEAAEKDRVDRITAAIGKVRQIPVFLAAAGSGEIQDAIYALEAMKFDEADYQEWVDTAKQAAADAIAALRSLVDAALSREAAALALRAEREAFERAHFEARKQAELEMAARAAEQRAQEERERAAREAAKAKADEERKAIQAERAKLAEAQARINAAQKALDEAKAQAEAQARERAVMEAEWAQERMDARRVQAMSDVAPLAAAKAVAHLSHKEDRAALCECLIGVMEQAVERRMASGAEADGLMGALREINERVADLMGMAAKLEQEA